VARRTGRTTARNGRVPLGMGGVSTVGLFAATGPAEWTIEAGNIFGLGLKGTGQPDEHPVADGLKFTKRHPVGGTSDRMILPLTRIGTVPHDTVATS
jgi:hypothetical protein